MYIWSLEKAMLMIGFQGRNGDTETEKRLADTVGEGEDGMDWGCKTEVCTLASQCVRWTASRKLPQRSAQRSLRTHRVWWVWEGGSREGLCTHIADSHCCKQKLTWHCEAMILQSKTEQSHNNSKKNQQAAFTYCTRGILAKQYQNFLKDLLFIF